VKTVINKDKNLVAVSRSGIIGIVDDQGRERERYKLPYGAVVTIKNDDTVEAGQEVATWDPHTHPIVTEVAGTVDFVDFVDGSTINTHVDEVTGLSSTIVTDPAARGSGAKDLNPMIRLLDDKGESLFFENTVIPVQYPLAGGAVVGLTNGVKVKVGDVVARLTQETSKTRDITGGLPRVADMFEARKPKQPAILAEITGTFSWGKETKGKKRLVITPDKGEHYELLIPKWRNLDVFEGEKVARGEMIADGEPSSHDILRLLGPVALAEHLVKEVQEVYRLQGVKINDKHVEIISRQMMRKAVITESGDTRMLKGEQLDYWVVEKENERFVSDGKIPAKFDRVLLGITKASLVTDSFISAASFQETTRVLTEASVKGARDDLRGLKENVIVGRLIPAGTGFTHHVERRKKKEDVQKQLASLMDVSQESSVSSLESVENGESGENSQVQSD
jgi:DNA-directed RNA polymerase subunit beta'